MIKNLKNQSLIVIFLLTIITWIAHFWHFETLGLYADDYNYIVEPMRITFPEFSNLIKTTFSTFSQGRVIGFSLLYLSAFLAGHLGGLKLLYIIAYMFALINNLLFYIFLKCIWNQPFFVLFGTLAFTLFPADTTRAFLTHIHILPAYTFLLLAFLCYFCRREGLSYIFITASLMCYETIFLLFITAPFLKTQWGKNSIEKLIKHALILVFIFIAALIIRKITGESRVNELDILTTLSISIRQTFIGPFISLAMFFYAPFQTLKNLKGELLVFVTLILLVLIWFLSKLNRCTENESFLLIKKLSLEGTILLFLAYPLTLTVPATEISGRGSRVHTAAALGASILVGLACYLLVNLANNYQLKNLALAILAGLFALLVGFGLTVQYDNQISWQYQQAFWTDVIRLAPDLTDEAVILVDAPNLPWGKQLSPFDWSMPSILPQIYNFPVSWKFAPKLYKLSAKWQDKIGADGKLKLDNEHGLLYFYYPWESKRSLKTNGAILLQEKEGKLIRRNEPIIVGNKEFQFKQISASTVQSLSQGVLYPYLIKPSRDTSINYFQSW